VLFTVKTCLLPLITFVLFTENMSATITFVLFTVKTWSYHSNDWQLTAVCTLPPISGNR
jgi:hypothetical protein